MNDPREDFWRFSRQERQGTAALLLLMLGAVLFPHLYPLLFPPDVPDFSGTKQLLAQWAAQRDSAALAEAARPRRYERRERPAENPAAEMAALFPFDPNTAERDELLRLGISARVANTIVKYRSRGGRFYAKGDLLKIFGMDEATYARLQPYIQLPDERPRPQQAMAERPLASQPAELPQAYEDLPRPRREARPDPRESLRLDVNAADAEAWKQLRGIGDKLSARIVKYREALGGFHDVAQVGEVYGLPDSTFQRLRPQLLLGQAGLRRINLNTASVEELSAHPYISKRLAEVLVNYRQQHGPYKALTDMKNIKIMDAAQYEKLLPYLSVL